jgi:hypothetical protein
VLLPSICFNIYFLINNKVTTLSVWKIHEGPYVQMNEHFMLVPKMLTACDNLTVLYFQKGLLNLVFGMQRGCTGILIYI